MYITCDKIRIFALGAPYLVLVVLAYPNAHHLSLSPPHVSLLSAYLTLYFSFLAPYPPFFYNYLYYSFYSAILTPSLSIFSI